MSPSKQPVSELTKLRAANKNLRFLHEISQKISEKKPLPDLLNEIMESSKMLMQAEASSLLLYDAEDGKLHFLVATGEKGELIRKASVNLGEGIAGWVAEKREPLIIEDCYKDPRFNPDFDKKSNFRTRSMICVPLIRHDELLGVIEVINKKDGSPFDEEDLSLFEILSAQCAVAVQNHRLTEKQIEVEALERELRIAREIQQNLLPKSLPSFSDLEIASVLIPAKQVGGDYFNVFRIDEDQTLFFIADASGKSVPAALIVSIIDACIHSYLKMASEPFDLMRLVKTLNQILIESTTPSQFATGWFGLYRHSTGELVSVNAGHNPPYLLREGMEGVHTLNHGGIFLGSFDLFYESETCVLQENDVLVYFTDGVTEAWNPLNEEYGEERLVHTLLSNRRAPAEEILSRLQRDVMAHVGAAPQSDDFTCIVMKRK